MALTFRDDKGSALTIEELDGNFRHFTSSHTVSGSLILSGNLDIQGNIIPSDPTATLGDVDNPFAELFVSDSSIIFVSGSGAGKLLTPFKVNSSGSLSGSFSGDGSGLTGIPSGSSGADGTSGTSGIDGTNGTSGVDGTSGTSGTTGTSGTSGTTGTSGTSGTTGTSGTSGTSGLLTLSGSNVGGFIIFNGTASEGEVSPYIRDVGDTKLNIEATGSLNVSGSLQVLGDASIGGFLNVNATTTLYGEVEHSGSFTFTGSNFISGSLIMTGSAEFGVPFQLTQSLGDPTLDFWLHNLPKVEPSGSNSEGKLWLSTFVNGSTDSYHLAIVGSNTP